MSGREGESWDCTSFDTYAPARAFGKDAQRRGAKEKRHGRQKILATERFVALCAGRYWRECNEILEKVRNGV